MKKSILLNFFMYKIKTKPLKPIFDLINNNGK